MNQIAPVERRQVSPLSPQTFNELIDFADRAARSTMVPKDYVGKPENIILAVQMGAELGLAPMQSLQCIAVVNGRPAVFGDAMPGLCRQSPVCDDIEEWMDGEGDTMTAFCRATRVGKKPMLAQFSVADARKAGLWGKVGPWSQYPQRMLMWRARSWALRDAFPDVLRGLMAVEEARDIPTDTFAGPTIDAAKSDAPPASPEREAINASVPLRAAATAMPRAPTVRAPAEPVRPTVRHSIAPPAGAPDEAWRACLDKVAPAMHKLSRLALIQEMGDGPTCSDIVANGPGWAKAELAQIIADNCKRLAPPPDASDTASDPTFEELGEVVIPGEAKLAAGD